MLAARFPGVPNLGDVTTADWTALGSIHILTAGYPCQGFSLAGQRKGVEDDRFIWPAVADAIRVLRPRAVLLENVAGHRSLGFGRVLGDLATLGFNADWVSVRASDVGGAHKRERVFILAQPADSPGIGHWYPGQTRRRGFSPTAVGGGPLLPTPDATHGRKSTRTSLLLPGVVELLPTPRASPNENRQTKRTPSQEAGTHGRNLAAEICTLFPTPTAERYGSNQSPSPGAAVRHGLDSIGLLLPTPRATDGTKGGPNQRGSSGDLMLPSAVQPDLWGAYAPAVARWEAVLGRPAPEPTEPGRDGKPRLAARFVEWLMGLPDGHVCDVPGLSRNDQLRLLGNGVVYQQAAHALHLLIEQYAQIDLEIAA